MKTADATAEVFITAFEALPRPQRETILKRILVQPTLKKDIIDIARWLERENERSIPYEKVRQALKKAGRL